MQRMIMVPVATLSLLCWAPSAHAQMTWYPPIGNWFGSTVSQRGMTDDLFGREELDPGENPDGTFYDPSTGRNRPPTPAEVERRKARSRAAAPAIPAAPTAQAAATAATVGDRAATRDWSFRPDPKRRRDAVRAFFDHIRANDQAGAEAFIAAYPDPIGTLGQAIAPYGLSTSDAADALTTFVMISFEAAEGVITEGSRDQARAVRAQLADAFADSGLARLDPAERQSLADALLLQSIIVFDYNQQAQGNPAIRAAVRREAAAGLRKIGFDPDTIRLTPDGLALAR